MTGQLDPVLTCASCGTKADVNQDPHAWDSWSFGKITQCPRCNGQAEVAIKKKASLQAAAQTPVPVMA